MFGYEFQKQLIVLVGATIIYLVAIYILLDFTHAMLKVFYSFVNSIIAKLKENGYMK